MVQSQWFPALVCCALIFHLSVRASADESGYAILVTAGAHNRHGTDVEIPMPAGSHAGSWRLSGAGGTALPAVVDDRLIAHVVLPDLLAGERQSFRLVPDPAPRPGGLKAQVIGDTLRFEAAGRELCTYQGGAGQLPNGYEAALRRGGYISRLFSPQGALVTDDYPPNHRHHHGVWFAWTKTSFDGRHPDFWNMGLGTGTVEAISHSMPWQGSCWGGFHAVHRYRDLSASPAVTVLEETWDVTVQAPQGTPSAEVVDLVVRQTCATTQALMLPTYHYGGLGFRGNRAWEGPDGMRALTSEGLTRSNGNEARGRWCYLGGMVDGRPAGIAILSHPGNFRSPQPMRIHPSEPFFCFAPSQLGEWSIAPAAALVLRYRLVVTDGDLDAADIERRWLDWTEPPAVEFSP